LQVPGGVDGATALPMGGGVPPQASLNALVVSTLSLIHISYSNYGLV